MYSRAERKKDWGRVRIGYLKMFRNESGEYWLEDLRFSYEERFSGHGVVYIMQDWEKRTGFNVQIEDGCWKIAEM
jgi:hypothetical protein